MQLINNTPLIELLIKRLSKSKELDEIIIATTKNPEDNKLATHIKDIGFKCYRGSVDDVLSRYVNVGKKYGAKIIVRITGDCPLIDPKIVDDCIINFKKKKYRSLFKYFSTNFP